MLSFLLAIVFFFVVPSIAVAEVPQVKVKIIIKNAQTAIKNKSGEQDAEKQLMQAVLRADATNKQKADMYYLASELQKCMNEKDNKQIYLNQPYDTLRFFNTIYTMHQYMLACDSVETLIASKPRYRSKSRETMLRFRKTLLNGGKFLLQKQRYAKAYNYFDLYLSTPNTPILSKDELLLRDTLQARVSYWASLCAYNANEPTNALRYIDTAIAGAEPRLRPSLTEYKLRCHEFLGDSIAWLNVIKKAVTSYPDHDYFFLHLLDYYDTRSMYTEGIALCDTMLNISFDRDIYWVGKSQLQLHSKDYEGSIKSAEMALKQNDELAEAYYCKGVSYLNMAIMFSRTMSTDIRSPKTKRDRVRLIGLYTYAQEPMERVRQLMPDNPEKWAEPLYQIYLNLNKGEEFAEIEKLLDVKR